MCSFSCVHTTFSRVGYSGYEPQRNSIKVVVFNFQGIRNKISDLVCCIDIFEPDIILGTETHMNSTVHSSKLVSRRYHVIRKDRDIRHSSTAGGVLIATKNDLIVTP